MKQKRRVNSSPRGLTVSVTVVCDRNAAAASAEITQYIDGRIVTDHATGSAKREQNDVRDDVIATLVNLGRSLQRTARILVADASARQEHELGRRVTKQIRGPRPFRPPVRLSIAEIVQEWGYEAGDRAADRRGEPRPERPGQGRHERPGP